MASSRRAYGHSFLAAAVGVAIGLSVAAPAEASLPGRNGVIAYTEEGTSFLDTAAIAPSGRGFRRLLVGVDPFSLLGLPTFSPDGRRIAYSANELRPGAADQGPSLHLGNAHGAARREIPGPVIGKDPTWSSNGRELAFVQGRFVPGRGLGIVGVDGQGPRALTADRRDGEPVFSSRGQIAFVRGDDLYVINANGSGLRRLTRSRAVEASPDFSPDGRRLVFTSGGGLREGDIFTMSAQGGPTRRLLRSRGDRSNPVWRNTPVWSPDGRQVAFAFENAGDPGIGIVGVNGRGYRTIRRLELGESQEEGAYSYFSDLTWQPRR